MSANNARGKTVLDVVYDEQGRRVELFSSLPAIRAFNDVELDGEASRTLCSAQPLAKP